MDYMYSTLYMAGTKFDDENGLPLRDPKNLLQNDPQNYVTSHYSLNHFCWFYLEPFGVI